MSVAIGTPEELRRLLRADFTFSDQQFAAITAPLEPAVVIAGAGSGKTTVMAARVAWLVATGRVHTGEILGLTFTTKAAASLLTKIREGLLDAGLLGAGGPPGADEPEEPTVATYHSYAAGLLAEHGLRIGHEPDTRLLADASRYQLATRVMQRHRGSVEVLTESPDHVVRYLLALDAELAEHLVHPDTVAAFDATQRGLFDEAMAGETRSTYLDDNRKAIKAIDARRELLELVREYRTAKAELGLMDYSDQISLAAQLASLFPDVGALEREKFKVVLLDEYQDTSVAQARMLSALFSGADGECGLGHPVTAVGDPNQAIYGWRGASVSNILEFGRDFPHPDGPTPRFSLTVNRRSDRRILQVANHLAEPLYAARPELAPLQPKPDAGIGEVTVASFLTYDEELNALAGNVIAAREAMAEPLWREIGVLTRDNAHAADVFDALSAREIPVEIVGLKGLLRLPEVAEVVACLRLVNDVTDNAALLILLTGPRWAIGIRDLALLGRRARELAGGSAPGRTPAGLDLREQLQGAVAGADPAETACLGDALEDPGDAPYSPPARERFGLLAAELRLLRRAVGEPLLDLVRRIIDTSGIDVELAASVSGAAAARRDNLDLFVQAVAEFSALDGSVTLTALMAWLDAEDEFGAGLDVATPTLADSVKLLTVHRAKGLEWDAVFVVGVSERRFPSSNSRSRWVTTALVMPAPLRGDAADLPQLLGHRAEDLRDYKARAKTYDQVEELRLGYVAWTRARHQLGVSGWVWRAGLKGAAGPSDYLVSTRTALEGVGVEPTTWAEKPPKDTPNPYPAEHAVRPWPLPHHTPEVDRRREAAALVRASDATPQPLPSDPRVQRWDDELERLVREAHEQTSTTLEVALPGSLSATALGRLREDPQAFTADLARPMPRRPSSAARFGTRFHAWVEARFGQQNLFDPDELPGRADVGIDDEDDLRELIDRFEHGPFSERVPLAVEAPFALVLAGQVVRGRIDAVYDDPDGGFLVVDWKTSQRQDADPLQLGIYRLAWAELNGVPPERVRAAFHYVRTGATVIPEGLATRAELQQLLIPGPSGADQR